MNIVTLTTLLWQQVTHDTTALMRQQLALTPHAAKSTARRILDVVHPQVTQWHSQLVAGTLSREDFETRLKSRLQEAAVAALTAIGLARSRQNKIIKNVQDVVVGHLAAVPAASQAAQASLQEA